MNKAIRMFIVGLSLFMQSTIFSIFSVKVTCHSAHNYITEKQKVNAGATARFRFNKVIVGGINDKSYISLFVTPVTSNNEAQVIFFLYPDGLFSPKVIKKLYRMPFDVIGRLFWTEDSVSNIPISIGSPYLEITVKQIVASKRELA